MTGNTNKWRAPLAGLASLAMLATMGVAVTTANAAGEPRPNHTVTFSLSGKAVKTITVPDGASVADALHGYAVDSSLSGTDFTGWSNYNFLAPVNSSFTVNGTKANAGSNTTATVFFAGDDTHYFMPDGAYIDGFSLTYSGKTTRYTGVSYKVTPQGTLGNRIPVDKQDGTLVTAWNVYQWNSTTKAVQLVNQNLKDLSAVDTSTSAGDVIVIVPVSTATGTTVKKLTVTGNASTGYAIGAYADGHANADYTADVVNGQTVKLPGSWVNLGGSGYTSPNSLVDGTVSYAFGSEVKVSDNLVLGPSSDTTTSYAVTFLGADGSAIRTYRATDDSTDDLEGAFLAKTDREDITKITIPNFVVKGWKVSSGLTNVKLDGKSVSADYLFSADDFDNAAFTGNVVFTPVQGGTTATVKVTFRDANYVGKHDTVVVDAKGGEYLSSDKFPSWTRVGYVFAGWYLSDGNGNLVSPKTEFNSDKLVGDGLFANNFTVTATWEKVGANVLDAALAYINPTDSAKGYTDYFTSETWGNFKTVYNNVKKEKAALVYASSNGKVSDEDAAKLVSELKAGWEQLKIDAKGNPSISALNERSNSFVFRLHKDGLRLYSQTPSEIYAAQRTGWTVDNGYLFRAAPKAASKNKDVQSLADFNAAAAAVLPSTDTNAQSALADKLAAIADPIIKSVQRYSSPNGTDWVYVASTGTAEINSLKRGGWNYEGVAFVVPTFGGTPVVRFNLNGQHLMSTSATEQNALVRAGWTREGVAFRGL